jgi:hypothetical protein
LSVRTPQGLSYARATGFTPEAVSQFLSFFEPAMEKANHYPERLFNCDETGVTVVQHRHSKVLDLIGKRQISVLQAAERGVLITVVTCMSPTGNYVPLLLIFPRKNIKMELTNCTPPGSIYACHTSGWIQSDIFTDWFRHLFAALNQQQKTPSS